MIFAWILIHRRLTHPQKRILTIFFVQAHINRMRMDWFWIAQIIVSVTDTRICTRNKVAYILVLTYFITW